MESRRWWPTADEIAADVRRELAGNDPDMAMRLLLDGINQLPEAAKAERLDEALLEPQTTGDERWDTLLAASIRYRLHTMHCQPPHWTRKEPLGRFWWPTDAGRGRAIYDMANAPAELARVGIFLSQRDFEHA
ncbi:MAG: hypothetical protein WAS07_02180 [Micropruina sp.]|nr:hypothetical protein [Micropruina sp.]